MNETPFAYPVISINGVNYLACFLDETEMLYRRPHSLHPEYLPGSLIFDSDGKCWRILSFKSRSAHSFFQVLWEGKMLRVWFRLVEEPDVKFSDLQDAICTFIDFNARFYDVGRDGFLTGIRGERRKGRVRQANSVKRIIRALDLAVGGAPVRRKK